ADGSVFRIDDTGIASRDNDNISVVRMPQHRRADCLASNEVTHPWFGLTWVEADNQSFAMLAFTVNCEVDRAWAIRRQSGQDLKTHELSAPWPKAGLSSRSGLRAIHNALLLSFT